jgi:uncharacterized protein (DUF1697 family)
VHLLKFRNPQTYVQSGIVVFATAEKNLRPSERKLMRRLGAACQPQIVLRTTEELRDDPQKSVRNRKELSLMFAREFPG